MYEVGYPIESTSKSKVFLGFFNRIDVNINKSFKFISINYMNIYELIALIGGYLKAISMFFSLISNIFISNNIQNYRQINKIYKEKLIELKNNENNHFNNENDKLKININSPEKAITLLAHNGTKIMHNDKFKKISLTSVICLRNFKKCCYKEQDEKRKIYDFLLMTSEFNYFQKKINEIEVIKYLLFNRNQIKGINLVSGISNPKVNYLKFVEFEKDQNFIKNEENDEIDFKICQLLSEND